MSAPVMTGPVEYLLAASKEPYALAWAAVEPCAAGGFNVYPADPVDPKESRQPYWRPDERAARDTALAMCRDWAEQAYDNPHLYESDLGTCTIQESDGEHVLREETVPPPDADGEQS